MKYLAYILLIFIVLACTNVPSGVMSQNDFANVLADMYVAESYVDHNYNDFHSDSSRRLLKQSVLAKYGYESADFDSTLMWYGMHADLYLKVNDKVMEILKERDREIGSAISQSAASFFGDSVDVWSGARYAIIHNRFPSKFVSFEMGADDNQEPGDSYTWRVKLDDQNVSSIRWVILVQYNDSTSEYLNTTSSTLSWNEVRFATDSTKSVKALRGYLEPLIENRSSSSDNKKNQLIWLDSISLIRKRVNTETYSMDRSRLNALKELTRKRIRPDSVPTL